MNAHDRFLPDWFLRIKSRQITLPRFQRFEAWEYWKVAGLLTTVLRGLPAGATLILGVGDKEKFKSRTMAEAPETGERVTEQLLDGQQRLTALWRSLHDSYFDRTYMVNLSGNSDEASLDETPKSPQVTGIKRNEYNGTRYPLWLDNPRECWGRKHIPLSLLRPDILSEEEIYNWIETAVENDHKKFKQLLKEINALRDRIKGFNLPYLALPPSTPKDVALDVYIMMNTNAAPLSTYDIIVALVEEETEKSLHDHVNDLKRSVPRAGKYIDVPQLVLNVVALRQDRPPSQAGYQGIDFAKMINDWQTIVNGIQNMVKFLEEECIFDEPRLPSYIPLPILAAIWEHLPTQPDQKGNARLILRKFLWRAFLTDRYDHSSTTHALQDYRGLRKILCENASETTVPIFNQEEYPFPTREQIFRAGWPKNKGILSRALLALQFKCRAEDLANGAKVSVDTIDNQEYHYHHLFPAAILREAEISEEQIFRAMNCAFISGPTNLTISCKAPLEYLNERGEKCILGPEELKRRLATHLIPYEKLAVPYDSIPDDDRHRRMKEDYEAFLWARAEIIEKAATIACEGKTLETVKLL